ncbi:MAG: phospho-sugar mutase [Bacteroidales bacterium]|nr:phospho-sugar mutase [Bacteroidales bacterium]
MEKAVEERVNTWLNGAFDEETKAAVWDMLRHRPDELQDAFYKELEFGTGGMRGLLGVGTNRMNKYTVAMATQGLANYVLQTVKNRQARMAVAYDSRNHSLEFSEIVADVLSANGIQVFLFDSITPTPELSFSIRHLHCDSGVMITASHNPKEYNGYKAYWNDGGQLVAPHDNNVIAEVRKITSMEIVKRQRNAALVQYIGEEVHVPYLERIRSLSLHPEAIAAKHDLKIVYTPLHGTGVRMVPRSLANFGFTQVSIVEKQAIPDGNFSTVVSPNPEETAAMQMAIEQAKAMQADIVLATDPDADRIGVAVNKGDGSFELLNGNMTLTLLVSYLLKEWKRLGKIDGKQYVVKTVVTTELIRDIATREGVACYDVLTGFKFIADKILALEGKETFIAGGEESFGCLAGDFVRDKDGVISCSLLAELTAYAQTQGRSLYEELIDIYLHYGFYRERLLSITRKGQSGAEEIQAMMDKFRHHPFQTIHGLEVVRIDDILSSTSLDCRSGEKTPITLPKSNVLQYYLADGSKVTMRPSGTEPKIKFYFSVKETLPDRASYEAAVARAEAKIDGIIRDLNL